MENTIAIEVGDWVKLKNGTQGMTVVSYEQLGDEPNDTDRVVCKFRNDEGEETEEHFKAGDLMKLKDGYNVLRS